MIILGLNTTHGDSSACLIVNGKLVAAAEEERFTRIKHSSEFPLQAIDFCLKFANIDIEKINIISVNSKFTYNLFNKFIFFLKNPGIILSLNNRVFAATSKKNIIKNLSNFYNTSLNSKIVFVPHHLSHVYSTLFFLEENNNSIVFSFDGSGNFSTIETYLVTKNKIKLIKKNIFPHSLGFFYTTFTQFIGFDKYGDEYKFMGLAAYGKPIYYDLIKKIIINTDPFKLDMSFFNLPIINYSNNYPTVNRLYSDKLKNFFFQKFNFKEIDYESQISKDIAASVQKIFNEVVIAYLKKIKEKYNSKKIYLTGGCALNSVLIGKILESKIFDNVLVGPNPGDAGGAIGSAFYVCEQNNIKIDTEQDKVFLGPTFSNEEIKKKIIDQILNDSNYKISFYEDFSDLSKKAAELIKLEYIIFWFQDRMEWGPRALGNRSILANPVIKNIKEFINKKIKKRELFRPFAISTLQELANKNFYMNENISPNMNIVFKAKEELKTLYPDIVHADGTTRVQTVSEKDNPKFYSLLSEFYKITGIEMIINTSMNIESPIALSPMHAWDIFNNTEVKSLVLNGWLIQKVNH
jgi:carbamoyltransferase